MTPHLRLASVDLACPALPTMIVAGPCSAESHDQVMSTAGSLSRLGVRCFRAGLWKPRTRPGGFEGVGHDGLSWLTEVKERFGMKVATEVACADHAEAALAAGVDVLWIGARTSADPFAMQSIADVLKRAPEITVLVKNPISADVDLWIGALQRLNQAGITRLAAVHRGYASNHEHLFRNRPGWDVAIELKRLCPGLPILCDPSHIGGKRDFVASLAGQAVSMGFDGLMVEVHCSPETALSDAEQQLSPDEFASLLASLTPRHQAPASAELEQLRQRIDECDRELVELLSRRLDIARRIGAIKQSRRMPVVQTDRFDTVLKRQCRLAEEAGISTSFVADIMHTIHHEAIRIQLEDESGNLS